MDLDFYGMSTLRAWVLGHRIFRFWVFQVLVSFWFLGFLGFRFNGLRSGSPFLLNLSGLLA